MSQNSAQRRHFWVTTVIIAAVVFVLSTLYFAITSVNVSKIPSALLGKAASPFSVSWIQGQELLPAESQNKGFSLADFRGKVVVLNFWASWCVSCREEAHEFETYWQSVKGSNVVVVGIAIQDSVEAAKRFALSYGKTYMLGLDEDGKAAIEYGVSGVPETFVIDPNGIIIAKEVGPITVAKLKQLVPAL